MHAARDVVVCHLGRMEYEPAWKLQQRIQAELIKAKRSTPARTLPHVLLLLEHPPVYTLGKSGNADHLLASEELLTARGATFHRIDRGGDITYHGPGQLVGYPILDLDRFFKDIHRYLRELEEIAIRTCADFGVIGTRVDGRTGVWVGPDARGFERKICAMGIRCSRWVTMHGFALNVNTDLDYFSHIIPCGIGDRDVTSISRELDRVVEMEEVQDRFIRHFEEKFNVSTTQLRGGESVEFLDAFAASKGIPVA